MTCCARCASTPVTASIELEQSTVSRMIPLCAWCSQQINIFLNSVPDLDDLDADLVHAEECRCPECDPDAHLDRLRDHQHA